MPIKIWKNDSLYPPLLRETHGAPQRLFCLGQKPNPADKYFAIVGTRRPSIYGKQMAEEFSGAIAARGFVIVSGLAYGIDAIAHEAAINAGGRTIAVLGSGLDHITPTCNLKLAARIQSSGCILTEYEADVSPKKFTFPERNRIIAGMSIATLVIEAPERSGALITARLALDFNRDVFALPGNITQLSGLGSNKLIRDGKAFPVTGIQDIFDYLECGEASDSQKPRGLMPNEEMIYDLLKSSPLTIDQIIAETELPAPQITTLLSMLELKGVIQIKGAHAFVTR
ncbi:MAG: DNA-processing protein DprA [Patescibacteria group bacterium]